MKHNSPRLLTASLLLIGMISIFPTSLYATAPSADASRLTSALDQLDAWVGSEANGDKWRKYLGSRALRSQIEKGNEADPAIVSRVLEQYLTDAKGLDKKLFVEVRREIVAWRNALQQQYVGDLPKLAWASRGDYQPASREERLGPSRSRLRQTARALEKTLGTNSAFAKKWKRYLRWDRLAPHLTDEVPINSQTIADLISVLKRFRSNVAGLENPAFTKTAEALDQHLEMFRWYQLVEEVGHRARKKYSVRALERRTYMIQLLELEKQLSRHGQSSTIETSRKVGEFLALVQSLGQSPLLIKTVHAKFTQPNVFSEVAESALRRLAERPVDETQPVIDCILGARILGTARSVGCLTLKTLPSDDHVALELQLTGVIHSNTIGHKKPVQITSQGTTRFVATKHLEINDDQFLAQASLASARTSTKTHSIKKTGGNFGRRFVERIAWKKVGKSKSQSESIASQHAEQKITKKFDNQVSEILYEARKGYEQKARPPLVRLAMFPEYLQMSSTDHSVNIETTLASHVQMSTDTMPVTVVGASDFSMKVHESAVNNLIPSLLAGVGIKQESPSEPPQLLGDYPPWLKKVADQQSEKLSGKVSEEASENFKPFSVILNRTHPLSVQFDDQKVKLRIRIAELITLEDGEEQIRENLDFILTFDLIQNGNGIILRRVGDIEVFPTGFDPNPLWGDRLPNKFVGTRGALSKILKKRAESEKGLPKEISIPSVQIPLPSGKKLALVIQHLDCDNGWLSIGYQVP